MTTSTTSRRSLAILATGLLALVPVNLVASTVDTDQPDGAVSNSLLAPPQADGVWIVGNSIFKTGVDPETLETSLGGPPVDFEYHGGHYTSLWYLIAENALPTLSNEPSVIVWGFRPGYALLPAFRQNAPNDTELFIVEGDRVYEELAEGIEPPSGNVLDNAAVDVDNFVGDTALFNLRGRAAIDLASGSQNLGIAVADWFGTSGADLVRREVVEGDSTFLDVLNRAVTAGEVQLAEERVVDGVGDFISGEEAEFNDSFVPLIADRIAAQDMNQLVIIWPPRSVAEGIPVPAQDSFVKDAVAALTADGIPVLNLYDDPTVVLDFYASGDHFNVDGRDYVTQRVAEILRDLGYG